MEVGQLPWLLHVVYTSLSLTHSLSLSLGLIYFLGSIVNFSQDGDVHLKYIQVCAPSNIPQAQCLMHVFTYIYTFLLHTHTRLPARLVRLKRWRESAVRAIAMMQNE